MIQLQHLIEHRKIYQKRDKEKISNYQIIGEEFGKEISNSKFSWIIDPIDGTRSYVSGNPTWSNLSHSIQ